MAVAMLGRARAVYPVLMFVVVGGPAADQLQKSGRNRQQQEITTLVLSLYRVGCQMTAVTYTPSQSAVPKDLQNQLRRPAVECCESGCANTTVPGELGRQVINPHMQRSVLGTANSWPYNCWTATAYSSELFIPSE